MHPVEVLFVPLGWALRSRRPDAAASVANAPELATANRIVLTSPSFEDGQVIPAKHCSVFIGDDVSPALDWDGLPAGTADLVLVFEDIDIPASVPGIHTIAAFAPTGSGLPEGALTPANADVRFPAGRRGKYNGPRPLPGHGPHRYRFHLYALDTRVDLATVSTGRDLPAAVAGHVLASGTLTGVRTS